MDDTEFMTAGLCAQTDPEAFSPDKGEPALAALAICRRCPVQTECLDYAQGHDERYGIWGGTTARDANASAAGNTDPPCPNNARDAKRTTRPPPGRECL